jgi:hypothetical protein
MNMIPAYAWLACAGCSALLIVELVLWYKLHPLMLSLLLLPHKPQRELPRVQNLDKLRDFQGNGFTITWRFDRDARAILFRRRMSMGKKAYVTGAVRFERDGRARVQWAPSPLSLYPLLPGILLPILFLEGYQNGQDVLIFAGAMLFATVLVGAINVVGAWVFLRKTGLPELQQQLDSWLA